MENIEYKVICPGCQCEAPWVPNSEKYGSNFGASYMCYYCRPCDTYVGCHNNTREPLGTMAGLSLRTLRRQVHTVFDKIWMSEGISRSNAYGRLSMLMGKETHIGASDEQMCNRILEVIKTKWNFPYRFVATAEYEEISNDFIILAVDKQGRAVRYLKSFKDEASAKDAISSFYARASISWTPSDTFWRMAPGKEEMRELRKAKKKEKRRNKKSA